MNKKCFGYAEGSCKILTTPICRTRTCKFFKTQEQLNSCINKKFERIRKLSPDRQSFISEQYYNGTMPWNEGGQA